MRDLLKKLTIVSLLGLLFVPTAVYPAGDGDIPESRATSKYDDSSPIVEVVELPEDRAVDHSSFVDLIWSIYRSLLALPL